MKLNVKAFALTCGILFGIGLFLVTWWKIIFQGVTNNPTFIGGIFRGFTISPLGSVIGLVWAFVVGLIIGAVFAYLYNRIATKSTPKKD